MNLLSAITSLLLFATALPGHADSRGFALTAPLAGITIDGGLDDWPADLPAYALPVTAHGQALGAPDDHGLRLDYAHMQIQAAEYTQAISTLMALLQTEHRADALYYIGFCYAGLEQYAAAVDYMRKALAADPDNRGYQRSLAVLTQELER